MLLKRNGQTIGKWRCRSGWYASTARPSRRARPGSVPSCALHGDALFRRLFSRLFHRRADRDSRYGGQYACHQCLIHACHHSRNQYTGPACPRCDAPLTLDSITPGEDICPRCQGFFDATVFHPPQRIARRPAVAHTGPESAGSCANHPRNAAVTNCGRCGLFICSLCELDLHGEKYCPACFDRMTQGTGTSRRRPDFRDWRTLSLAIGIFAVFITLILLAFPSRRRGRHPAGRSVALLRRPRFRDPQWSRDQLPALIVSILLALAASRTGVVMFAGVHQEVMTPKRRFSAVITPQLRGMPFMPATPRSRSINRKFRDHPQACLFRGRAPRHPPRPRRDPGGDVQPRFCRISRPDRRDRRWRVGIGVRFVRRRVSHLRPAPYPDQGIDHHGLRPPLEGAHPLHHAPRARTAAVRGDLRAGANRTGGAD